MRETVVEGVCSNNEFGDACECADHLHREVAEKLKLKTAEMKNFDPLNLNPGRARAKTLAFLLVSFIGLSLISEHAFEMACGIPG